VLAVAAGIALGVAAEQVLVRKPWQSDPTKDEPFGYVRGEPHWLRASDGTQLYVEVHPADDPDAPTIVFGHGYCLNQDSWHFQRKALQGQARLVLWDQRGHGRSERGPRENKTIDQLGRDLQWVLDGFTDGPVTLVGHSMGGMTIMSLAAGFPETVEQRVTGVALVATSAGNVSADFFGLPAGVVTRAQASIVNGNPPRIATGPLVQRARYTDLNLALTRRVSFGKGAPNSLNEFTVQMLNATALETVVDFLPTLMTHDKYDALKVLDGLPVYIPVGELDVLTPPSHARRIASALPNAQLQVIPNTGHMIQLERADTVTEGIRALAFGDQT
jgi:pimeloyl-ACP methyl ester carboxylesterase